MLSALGLLTPFSLKELLPVVTNGGFEVRLPVAPLVEPLFPIFQIEPAS